MDGTALLEDLFDRFFVSGDAAAIEAAVRGATPRLLAVARRIAGPDRAEDVVQSAFLAVVRRGTLPREGPITAWLVTATVRIAYRQRALETRQRGLAARLSVSRGETDPTAPAVQEESAEQTRAAVARLPARYRDVVVLHHLEQLPVPAVAHLLGIPVESARTRLRRARVLLRSRMGALAPLLAGVWLVVDAVRPAHAAMGGLVKANSVVVAAVVALAVGGVVVATGDWWRTAPSAPAAPLPEVAATERSSPERLVGAPPPVVVAPTPPAEPVPAPAPTPPARKSVDERERVDRMTRDYLDTLRIPPTVAEEAKRLGVGDAALRSMYGAEFLLHGARSLPDNEVLRSAAEEALAALARHGEEGFTAVVANAQGNPWNTSAVDVMARATWRPGREAGPLAWLRAAHRDQVLSAPLRLLGGIDAPDVRSFLRGALVTYRQHAGNFTGTAQALAALRDTDAVAAIAEPLSETSWGLLRPALLDALGQIGGDDAKAALIDFLRKPRAGVESAALRALARIDESAARAEAQALLDGARAKELGESETRAVRAFLAR